MNQIKNIIFDLGGVLLDLDFTKPPEAFKKLGFPQFESMFSQFKVDQLFEKLEKGMIDEREFYTIMLKVGKEGTTPDQIKFAWNSMLLDFRTESLEYLKKLAPEFNLFLLSNTNSIHLEAVNSILKKQTGLSSLNSFFTKSYYSHFIGLRKPDNNIFEFVAKDAGIQANETLFIDDTKDNIYTAQRLGFKTHLLLPGEKIEKLDLIKISSLF
ncbi:MAG: HAD family phosphatase [Ferruginibacter sp.]